MCTIALKSQGGALGEPGGDVPERRFVGVWRRNASAPERPAPRAKFRRAAGW